MIVNNGSFPVGVRTRSSVDLAGVAPKFGTTDYVPMFVDGMYRFADSSDATQDIVDAGGLVDYGGSQIICIKEVRAHAGPGSKVTVEICDRDGTNPIMIVGPLVDADDTVYAFGASAYILLTSQVVTITTTGMSSDGCIDIYTVIGEK